MPDDVAHIPLPDRLGLIELPATGRPSLPETERAWMERAVADIGRRADRVRRGIKAASEALAAFGRKDPTVAEAEACVQRTFAAQSYVDAKGLLASAATAHERAAKALENIAGWLKSPVGFTGGAADFRPNGKAHDLAQMDRDSVSPGGAKVEDLEVWIERAKRHIIILVEKLGEDVGLVRLEADERFEVPPDLKSEWDAKRHIIDEMARDIRTLARTLSRDSVADDQVLKRAPEAVQGEFNQTRPHFDLETVIERLLDSHTRVRATLGPIGKVLYPEAGGKSASAERNEAAIAEACRGAWIKADAPLTAATLEEWHKKASVPKKPARPPEFLPEKLGLVSLRPELRLELDDDELAQWRKLRPDLERDALDLQAFIKELRADPVLARALEIAQAEFDAGGKRAKAAEVMEAARGAHAEARRRLLAVRDWLKAPAEDGSGRTNVKARDVVGLAKTARAPKGLVTGEDIDAWLERARALPLIELEKPKPPPEPKKERPPEPPQPKPPAPKPPPPKPLEPKVVEPKPVEKPAPEEKPKKPEKNEKPKEPAPKRVEPAPAAEQAKPVPKPDAKPGPKPRAGLWVGLAVVGLAAGGGLYAWKPWDRQSSKDTVTPPPPPPPRVFDEVFRAETGALSASTDPRASKAIADARSHFDGTAERWDEARIRQFLKDQLAAINTPGVVPFATQFAALIKRVQDEYVGGPGEGAARAAQTAAEQAYARDATQGAAVSAEFERALGQAKRKFDVEFAAFAQSAAAQQSNTDQKWLDEWAKQAGAWNAGTAESSEIRTALTAKLKELGTPAGTAFTEVWDANRPWSGGVSESDWQIGTWKKVRDQLESTYTPIVPTSRVAQLRKDAEDAWGRMMLHPPLADASPDEAAKLGPVFAPLFEARVRQLNEARRAALEAYTLNAGAPAPADPKDARNRLLAAFANAQELLGALRAGWALDERPTGVAWTGGTTLREKFAAVLTQQDVGAAELGLEPWRGAESAADWPAKLSDLNDLPADQQRAAWRSALHRFVADATTTRGAAPEAWTALNAAMSKLATMSGAGAPADAQKRDDFNRVASLLDAHQPAADHGKLLDALRAMGTLAPPAAGAPDPYPVLRANLALRKLALENKGADPQTLALLRAITDSLTIAAKVPDARRIYDALTTQPVNADPPSGWTTAQGTLGDPSVVLQNTATGDRVGFVLLTPQDSNAPRTYLAADEMSASLFVAAMGRQFPRFPEAQRSLISSDIASLDGDLPRSWHLQQGRFLMYSNSELPGMRCEGDGCIPQARRPWLALSALDDRRTTPPYPEPVPAPPGPNSPAQLISGSLAKAAVDGLNLRLPTTQEWVQAFRQANPTFANDGTGAQAFLCGDKWPQTGTLNRIASSAVFNNPPGGNGPHPRVLFEDVNPIATSFRHLIGNVAEVTMDGNTYRALGGSAFATQNELGNPDKASEPKSADADLFFADLGIRPAFNTAASRPPPVVGPNDLLVRRP